MKIVINAIRVSRQSGGGLDHYIIHLVNELAKLGLPFDLYTFNPGHFQNVKPEHIIKPFSFCHISNTNGLSNIETVTQTLSQEKLSKFRSFLGRSIGDMIKLLWTQFIFPFLLVFRKYDILFSPSQLDALFFTPENLKQVITVLDLIPFILTDQKHKHELYLKYLFPIILRKADHIITISGNTKQDVIKFFGIASQKITPVLLAKPGEGVSSELSNQMEVEEFKRKFGLTQYILCVSGNHPHKNLKRLIEAFFFIKDQTRVQLVIVGYQDKAHQIELDHLVKNNKVEDRIKFFGHVSSEKLSLFYKGAEIFIFPSLYEGFGLPPLEALSYGVPTVVSQTSSLPEVVGDAGLYFDPQDIQDMAHKILQLLNDQKLQEILRRKGMERAKVFAWEKTGELTLEVFEKLRV